MMEMQLDLWHMSVATKSKFEQSLLLIYNNKLNIQVYLDFVIHND